MPTFLKSSFLWQFAGGFAIGAAGLFALNPAQATNAFHDRAPITAAAPAAR